MVARAATAVAVGLVPSMDAAREPSFRARSDLVRRLRQFASRLPLTSAPREPDLNKTSQRFSVHAALARGDVGVR